MVEKDFQTLFKKYLENGGADSVCGAFELKLARGRSIPFDSVRKHQTDALLAISTRRGLYHKIADAPVSWLGDTRMRFGKPKPFDCFFLKDVDAYVVVLFYEPRRYKWMAFIDPVVWEEERKISTRKSLTMDRARQIARYWEKLK